MKPERASACVCAAGPVSVPVFPCPRVPMTPGLPGSWGAGIPAEGPEGGFPGLGESICVAVAMSLGSNAHLLPSLFRCRPPAHSSLSPAPVPSALPIPLSRSLCLLSCPAPPCSAPAAPAFPGSLVHPHPPRGPSVPPSAPAARRMARPAAAPAGTAPLTPPQGVPWVWGPWAS